MALFRPERKKSSTIPAALACDGGMLILGEIVNEQAGDQGQ